MNAFTNTHLHSFLWKIPFDYITCDQPGAPSNTNIMMETKTSKSFGVDVINT